MISLPALALTALSLLPAMSKTDLAAQLTDGDMFQCQGSDRQGVWADVVTETRTFTYYVLGDRVAVAEVTNSEPPTVLHLFQLTVGTDGGFSIVKREDYSKELARGGPCSYWLAPSPTTWR